MKKPGKVIELTTSAQIAGWRQRLDVLNILFIIFDLDWVQDMQTQKSRGNWEIWWYARSQKHIHELFQERRCQNKGWSWREN